MFAVVFNQIMLMKALIERMLGGAQVCEATEKEHQQFLLLKCPLWFSMCHIIIYNFG